MQAQTGAAASGPVFQRSPEANGKPTVFRILLAISLVHLFNDSIQSIIPAILPILKDSMNLTYMQSGIIVFALNMTASIMQPVIGLYSDRRPSPYMLPMGMGLTFIGVLGLAFAPNYWLVLLSVLFIGLGSAVFHPEGSRVAYMAGGSRRGLAQSIFQVGGNSGQSLAPLMTAFLFVPLGQFGAIWFTAVAGLAILVQLFISRWYSGYIAVHPPAAKKNGVRVMSPLRKKQITFAILTLIFLVFARSWYHAGVTIYYPFYLMEQFGITLEKAQIYIFLFAAAGALGTFMGGPLSDKFGRRNLIFFSMVGSAPLALLLPYANPFWAYVILLVNGFIILSSFSVSVVYAQELIPGKIGTVSGLITGLAFGLGALGAVALGGLIDALHLPVVMQMVSILPLIGLLTFFLPHDRTLKEWAQEA
ncbi:MULTISPECIES: MFS transporter [unclassified Paenibacillus]|uniref:MFS transporter n=1 Tax=unclassified Paenibacillus TaxID=185978 RepID=UPI001AE56D94|nr:MULTISPECIES: MFS transporter [unclassified Paenibacillus]MBP1156678.1 FSR family fosmidomycin resistance protein-like MFS transporter [Paenibacillus sp. PvP091]MBP1172584.1 FSR family fosmidomycin resistance protein-like MFS transporter [Paenibacillus sp. PvR098]MBP2438964.1 FSR family fosmidomycin resistance protein-like MFS transporter [Paenibacillus sp. PvP052]